MEQVMNIVIGSSREYAKYAKVLLQSIFVNNPVEVHVYYYHAEEMNEELEEISQLAKSFGNIIHPMEVTFEEEGKVHAWNNAVWYRWRCITELRETCERALVLGVDVIVNKDISEFYYQDFGDKLFVMGHDMVSIFESDSNILRKQYLESGIEKYVNSDICLVDLKSAYKYVDVDKMLELQNQKQYYFLDQDVLNYHFTEHIRVCDPLKYNYMTYIAEDLYDYEDTVTQLENAQIIHYAGTDKPWRVYRGRQSEDIWFYYAEQVSKEHEWDAFKQEQLHKNTYDVKRRYHKMRTGYEVLNTLLECMEQDVDMGNYFGQQNIKSVAIYGAGLVGKHLYNYIKDKVEVTCFVDSANRESYCGIPAVNLETLPTVDLIIVAVGYDVDKIKKNIASKTEIKAIGLKKLLDDCL